jgi:hypothetical protein
MKKLFLLVCVLLLYCLPLYAGEPDSSGGTRTTDIKGNYEITLVEIYNNFSLSNLWGTVTGHSGEYAYNESGDTSASAGWIDTSNFLDHLEMFIFVPVAPAITGTLTVRLDQRDSDTGTGTTQISQTFSGISTGALFPIEERPNAMRVGINVTSIGNELVTVVLKGIRKIR